MKCHGYKTELTPWDCLENQLSSMCLPGWPCETCEAAVTIMAKPTKAGCATLSRPTAKRQNRRMPAWLKNASKAVIRDWLREHAS